MKFPLLTIDKIINYLSAFYDLVAISMVCQDFHQRINLQEIEKNLPIKYLIKRKYISSLTDYLIYLSLQNPDRLHQLGIMNLKQIKEKCLTVKGYKTEIRKHGERSTKWDLDVRHYYRFFIPLKTKYQLCLEWKKIQIDRQYSFCSPEERDQLFESLKDHFTFDLFLKQKYSPHLLNETDFNHPKFD